MAKKTVAKTSKKKITAPVAYKPTKGRPREYLAYLNQREMDYLRSINGDNMERGPRGLPSFPPDDAIGSSSKSSSSTSKSSSTGARGPTGPGGEARSSPAGNAGGAPGSSTRTSGGNLGGGGKGSTASKDLGIAGVPGGASRTGGSLAPSGAKQTGGGSKGPTGGTLSAPARTAPSAPSAPKSPMGNQGTSYSTPAKAATANADKINQQATQTKDAKEGLQNTPAVNKDLSAGGIKTLNVGPMSTPVSVQSVAKLGPVASERNFADSIISAGSSIAGSIADAASYAYSGVNSLLGSPTKASGPLGKAAYDRVAPTESFETTKLSGPLGPGAYERIPGEVSQPVSESSVERMKEQYSMYKNPAAVSPSAPSGSPDGRTEKTLSQSDIAARNARLNELAAAPDEAFQGYENYDPLSSYSGRLPTSATPTESTTGIRTPGLTSQYDQERILSIETVPEVPTRVSAADYPREMMLRPGMYRDPYTEAKLQDAYRNAVVAPASVPPTGGIPGGGLRRTTPETSYTPGDYEAYRGSLVSENIPTEDAVDSPYISPVQQMPAYPEKTPLQKYIAERIPYVKYAVKGATLLGKKEFESLSPREQADLQEKWAKQNASYIRGGATAGGNQYSVVGGGSPDIGSGGKNEYRPVQSVSQIRAPQQTITAPAPSTTSSERPEIYYSWDVGVNIPSPNDPDYTLYLRYLQERAAAQAALGIG